MDTEKLLKKLEEENQLLEGDSRCHTKILGRSGSNASMQSAKSANSQRNSVVVEVEELPSAMPTSGAQTSPPSDTPTTEVQTSPPSTTPTTESQTTPPQQPASEEDKLATPPSSPETPVKSKPAAPYFRDDSSESSQADEEGEGLGPEASVILDDGLETRINLKAVLPSDVGVASGSGQEDEAADEFGSEANLLRLSTPLSPPSGEDQPRASKTSEGSDGEESSEGQEVSTTEQEVGGAGGQEVEKGGEAEEVEERDVLKDLKPSKGSGATSKRARSETETGRKVSLASLVGRVRSQTINDSAKEKHLANKGEEDGVEVKLSPEEELWSQWSQLLKTWEESGKRQAKQIKQLARQGIPEHLRGMAWQLLSNSQNQELKEYYPSLITEVSPHERAIQRDLARTFPEHSFFKERDGLGQESLLNVLKAYSVYDREVGYCQGSPFISGLLLMQMPEEDAFCVFVSLMKDYRLRELYKPSMADLGLCFHLLEKSMEDLFPNLYLHFRAVGFQTSMYASPWFLTMFASVLSLNVVFRIMDIFFVEGREIVFRVGLALLEHSHDKLIQLDMEDMLKHFQKEMRTIHEADPDALINRALRIRYNAKKMKKIEKEFVYRKEKQSQDNATMVKLRSENNDLGQRLLVLEKECASLADQLIQGQVRRAEEAEEMIELRKQLAMMKRRVSELDQQGEVITSNDRNMVEEEAAPADPGAEGIEVEFVKAGSPEIYTDSPKPSPVPERRKERTESRSSQTSEVSLDPSDEKLGKKKKSKKHKKFKSKLKEKDTSSLPNTPMVDKRDLSPGLDIDLAKELARAKTNWADASNQLEEKSMELTQALEREAFVVRELRASRDYVTALEHKLSEIQLERQACPYCSKKMEQDSLSDGEGAIVGSSEEVKPVDLNSSKALLSHLHSLWQSSPSTNGQDLQIAHPSLSTTLSQNHED